MLNYRKIGFDSYYDYLNSDHWRQLKREYWESGQERCCRICERRDGLVLHHRTYRTLGKENVYTDVVLLCLQCHHDVHFFGNQKTPLEYRYLFAREQYLYKKYRSFWGRVGRFRIGSFINSLYYI